MTDVSALGATTSTSLTTAASGGQTMGKTEFLKLLVAQLQNQDPLNPQDPTEFTAQLAQYSSLEQQFTMNEQLAKMAESSGDVQRLTALSLIGKEITAESSLIELAPSTDASLAERLGYTPGVLDGQIGYRLDAAASSVKLNIFNDKNVLVSTVDAPASAAGDHFVNWDGKGFSGNLLPAGDYTVEVSASNPSSAGEDAETITATAIVKGVVIGVELGASGNELTTSAGSVPQSAVTNINLMTL